jgi:hypothetical protein
VADGEWTDVYDASGNLLGLAKSAEIAPLRSAAVRKADGEPQRFCLGIAYQAGPDPRIAKGADGGRDYFTEAELEKACWSFLRSGAPQIGIGHADGSTGAAVPVESFINRNPVPWVVSDDTDVRKALAELAVEAEKCAGPDDLIVRPGDWCLGAILSNGSWKAQQAGNLNGWSPQGGAVRRRRVSA